ncbi:unnamed protein product [Gongylonema pulchrum]|uniref:Uncharacterized protein n=1 Tax=Gongylonema pulchrum TaxID=637853 RepID=A0A183D3J0_9BILA|nr:unnamed protein product [Gongylonema pulchrum]
MKEEEKETNTGLINRTEPRIERSAHQPMFRRSRDFQEFLLAGMNVLLLLLPLFGKRSISEPGALDRCEDGPELMESDDIAEAV